jgi:malonyl-CoA/methylmalonyl-CoA synthetase
MGAVVNRPTAGSRSGIWGWCSADGYYTITGQARELIITGGYNVYPREIEDMLGAIPEVAEVAVLGLSDPDLGEQVVAVIVPKPGCSPDPSQLIAYCRGGGGAARETS